MKPAPAPQHLSRRERQVMDIIYHRGRATAAEVLEELPDQPSYSAVRAALRLLEEKGSLRHEQDGKRYVYIPTVSRSRARSRALQHLLRTFFNGSSDQVVTSLIEDARPTPAELDRMAQLIERARRKEKA